MKQRVAEGRVHFGPTHHTVPNNKTYLASTETQSLSSVRYVDGRAASKRLATLFGNKVFNNPKDELLLRDIYRAVGVDDVDIVLDMFSGSGSAMQAVWELNSTAGTDCRFIGIQVAEDLNQTIKTAKGAAKQITANAMALLADAGRPQNVAEICKERLRRAGKHISGKAPAVDVGFRSLKVADSNMLDVFRTPDVTDQLNLSSLAESVKPDRSGEDLLFQVMLEWGLEMTMPVIVQQIDNHEVFVVEGGALVACFDAEVGLSTVRIIAEMNPIRAVFRDSGFGSDDSRINAEQLFREISPSTDVKAI